MDPIPLHSWIQSHSIHGSNITSFMDPIPLLLWIQYHSIYGSNSTPFMDSIPLHSWIQSHSINGSNTTPFMNPIPLHSLTQSHSIHGSYPTPNHWLLPVPNIDQYHSTHECNYLFIDLSHSIYSPNPTPIMDPTTFSYRLKNVLDAFRFIDKLKFQKINLQLLLILIPRLVKIWI